MITAVWLGLNAVRKLEGLRSSIAQGLSLLRGLLSLAVGKSVSAELASARIGVCEKCLLFNKRLKTCGTAGEIWINPKTKRTEPFGCWCHLPVAVWTRKNCWLSQVTQGEQGWPVKYNSNEEYLYE